MHAETAEADEPGDPGERFPAQPTGDQLLERSRAIGGRPDQLRGLLLGRDAAARGQLLDERPSDRRPP
jgi:hypothetical protein